MRECSHKIIPWICVGAYVKSHDSCFIYILFIFPIIGYNLKINLYQNTRNLPVVFTQYLR